LSADGGVPDKPLHPSGDGIMMGLLGSARPTRDPTAVPASHYQQLLDRLAALSLDQRATFAAMCFDRALRAFTAARPGDSAGILLREGLDAILGWSDSTPSPETLASFDWTAEQLLQSSTSTDDGEARDRIGFFLAAGAMLVLGIRSGRLGDPKHAALCAAHVIHIREQVYDNDDLAALEQDWQVRALDAVAANGPVAGTVAALADYPPGPLRRRRG
jgi:hypothetical protein